MLISKSLTGTAEGHNSQRHAYRNLHAVTTHVDQVTKHRIFKYGNMRQMKARNSKQGNTQMV